MSGMDSESLAGRAVVGSGSRHIYGENRTAGEW